MAIVERYTNAECGNSAYIEEVFMHPYKGAPKEWGYRTVASCDYDDGFVYDVSCYETLGDAKAHLKSICFDV